MAKAEKLGGFGARICEALGLLPLEFAELIGAKRYSEVLAWLALPLPRLNDPDLDENFIALSDVVDRKIGLLMGLRADMQKHLDKARKERAVRRLRVERR